MTHEEIAAWLNTKIPCEPDCGGGCEGAGCGYTREDILGSFRVWEIPMDVIRYLAERGWDEFKDIERVEREREQHEDDIRRSERRERRMEGDRGRYR